MAPNLRLGELRFICYFLVPTPDNDCLSSKGYCEMVMFFVHLFGCTLLGKTVVNILLAGYC